MKFIDLYNQFEDYPLIEKKEVKKFFPKLDSRRFYEWQKKGYIEKLSSNFYIFNKKRSKFKLIDFRFIANRLHDPSYLSLEYALDYYGLIPEAVFSFTSVTTRKTKEIHNDIGNFYYRKIKKELFFGYNIKTQDGISYKIAKPEKALLDFLYLRSDIKDKYDLEGLRINEQIYREELSQKKIKEYLGYFNSDTLSKKIEKLNKII